MGGRAIILNKAFQEKKLSLPQVLALGFLSAIAIGTIFLILPAASSTQKSIGFINALFTATSATCVTGLIVLDTGKDFSTFGQLIILILIPVSYTHLRAHETDSYLVCRLLLEK